MSLESSGSSWEYRKGLDGGAKGDERWVARLDEVAVRLVSEKLMLHFTYRSLSPLDREMPSPTILYTAPRSYTPKLDPLEAER